MFFLVFWGCVLYAQIYGNIYSPDALGVLLSLAGVFALGVLATGVLAFDADGIADLGVLACRRLGV